MKNVNRVSDTVLTENVENYMGDFEVVLDVSYSTNRPTNFCFKRIGGAAKRITIDIVTIYCTVFLKMNKLGSISLMVFLDKQAN
jgi:hypothetical protein